MKMSTRYVSKSITFKDLRENIVSAVIDRIGTSDETSGNFSWIIDGLSAAIDRKLDRDPYESIINGLSGRLCVVELSVADLSSQIVYLSSALSSLSNYILNPKSVFLVAERPVEGTTE
jgi:hypothetical protein